MTKWPEGVGVKQDDTGITLARTTNGVSSEFFLSPEEAFGFMGTIATLRDRILQQSQAKSGQVQPIVSLPVAQVRVLPNALGTDVLLTFAVPSGEQTTFSLPLYIADHVATEIRAALAEMPPSDPRSYS
jgi:hypothetical protein